VVRLLEINPDLRIELSAHTDDQGSDRYNDLLSRKRGEAARSYLIRRGVDASRVTATGYGKRKPLVPNDSDEHRAMNRRVEFKVL
jgi:outer membrane protein OmpA-like peptidoglycan-associated protein